MTTVRRKDRRGDFHRVGIDVAVDGVRQVPVFRPRLRKPKKKRDHVVVQPMAPATASRLSWWRRAVRWLKEKL